MSMDEDIIHKSRPKTGQPEEEPERETEPIPRRRRRRYTGWYLALAIVLVVCIVGGSVFFIRRGQSQTSVPAGSPGWCGVPDSSLYASITSIYQVAAISANDIWVLGAPSAGVSNVLEHWNGKHWTLFPGAILPASGGNTLSIEGLEALSTNDIWAIAQYGSVSELEHWDGSRWQLVNNPASTNPPFASGGQLYSFAASSASDVWVIGGTGPTSANLVPLLEHWDGQNWSLVHLPNDVQKYGLTSMVALSPADAWLFASIYDGQGHVTATTILRWDGQNWQQVPLPDPQFATAQFNDVKAVSATDIWAVGSISNPQLGQAEAMVVHWDGQRWTRLQVPAVGNNTVLTQLSIGNAKNIWAIGQTVGTPGHSFLEHWDGKSWSQVTLPKANGLQALTAIASLGNTTWVARAIVNNDLSTTNPLLQTNC